LLAREQREHPIAWWKTLPVLGAAFHAEWHGEGSPPWVHAQERIERSQSFHALVDMHSGAPISVTDVHAHNCWAR
jgi:hypothetical protein